jgi:hypothetical protein
VAILVFVDEVFSKDLPHILSVGAAGAAGGAVVVVKLQAVDQSLDPPAFVAFTRQ